MNGTLPIGYYGKLPFYEEYLETKKVPDTQLLKNWVRSGRERAQLDSLSEASVHVAGANEFCLQTTLRFIVTTSDHWLIGILRPSRDLIRNDQGGRAFPFMVFSRVPRSGFKKTPHLVGLLAGDLWRNLDEVWDVMAAAPSKTEFERLIEVHEFEIPHTAEEYQSSYRASLKQDEQTSARLGGMQALSEMLKTCRANVKKAGKEGFLVRFPTVLDARDAEFEASFLLDLIGRQFFFKKPETSIFIRRALEGDDAALMVKFGALHENDFQPVVGRGMQGSHGIIDFIPEIPNAESGSTDVQSYEALLAKKFK